MEDFAAPPITSPPPELAAVLALPGVQEFVTSVRFSPPGGLNNADLRVAVKERSRRKEMSRRLARLQVVLDGRAQFLERSPMPVNPKTGPDSFPETEILNRVVMVDGFMPPIPEVLAAVLANRLERRCAAEGTSRESALEWEHPAVVSALEKRWAASRPDLSSLAAQCLRLRESVRENYLHRRCRYSGVVCTAGGRYLATSATRGRSSSVYGQTDRARVQGRRLARDGDSAAV